MKLSARLDGPVVALAILPFCLMLVVANYFLLRLLEHRHQASLSALNATVAGELERRLAAEAARLSQLATQPVVLQAVPRAGPPKLPQPQDLDRIADLNEQWETVPTNDATVLEVIQTPAADFFHREMSLRRDIQRMVLLNPAGELIAASYVPSLFDFSGQRWWKTTSAGSNGRVVSDGLSRTHWFDLNMAIGQTNSAGPLRGVLREELDGTLLTRNLPIPDGARDTTLMLVSRNPVFAGGSQSVYDGPGRDLSVFFRRDRGGSGWYEGVRYTGRKLDGSIIWMVPIWVVTMRQEGILPIGILGPMTVSIVVSLCTLIGWIILCRRAFGERLTEAHASLLDAGEWVIRTALGRRTFLSPSLSGSGEPAASPIQQELQEWMRRMLQDFQDQYVIQTQEMQEDLNLARDFQKAFIDRAYPTIPTDPKPGELRLEFFHRYQAALALGGDFFDITTISDKIAGVFIADVMGHGTRSALITSILRTLIDDLSPYAQNVRKFLAEMNKQCCALLKNVPNPLFTSAFYFVADTISHSASYSSAGHPAPFLLRRSDRTVSRLDVPEPRGAALGLLPKENYTGGLCRLLDGDLYIFFTDGLYEARNMHGEQFGLARMEKVLTDSMTSCNAEGVVNALMEAVSNFLGYEPISDDICVVAVEVTTKPRAGGERKADTNS